MKCGTELRGITWNHSRAVPALVATAQRFEELHPGVRIHWEKRTLDEFGHASLRPLAEQFDLLVIDHPMLGSAARDRLLAPLDESMPGEALEGLRAAFVGRSFESYVYGGHLWAVPIDAAAPAASYRPDLLTDPPQTWPDVLELARDGRLVMPGFPADVFLNFMGFCVTLGGTFAHEGGAFIECDAGLAALDVLRELAARLPPQVWDWNPIAMYEAMGSSEAHAYCPFAYTYSNYARVAFVPHPLRFAEPPTLEGYGPVRTILGGTGLAVSRRCRHIDTALVYALAVSGAEWQRGIYALAGGQPAHRLAWSDRLLNDVTGDFFSTTRASVERAVVRPRCPGYTEFQAAAGKPVVEYLRRGGPARRVIADLDGIYQTFCRQSGAI